MARVVRIHQLGGPEVLQIEELEVGEPGPGEARIRVEAIGLNRAEAEYRAGRYPLPTVLPSRMGYEAAGVVEAVGDGVEGFAPGDAIGVLPSFSFHDYGTYAEQAIVPASALVERPPGLSATDTAALWMAYLTAWGGIVDIGRLSSGEALLATAASSSVALAAMQIARSVGAVPIAATRTSAKKEALAELGAAYAIATEEEDLAAEVMRVTDGRGARVVFDPIGGPGVQTLADAAALQGIIVLYGNIAGRALETPFPFLPGIWKGLSLRAYIVREVLEDPERLERGLRFVRDGLAAGWLRPTIARTFAFDEIVEAHRYLESSQQVGKIVVTVGGAPNS